VTGPWGAVLDTSPWRRDVPVAAVGPREYTFSGSGLEYIAALTLTTVTKLTQISIFTHSNHAASTALATGLRRACSLSSDDFERDISRILPATSAFDVGGCCWPIAAQALRPVSVRCGRHGKPHSLARQRNPA
jgi:hypothetical protein